MNFQIDYLRTFIALADTRGFTRAGRLVHRSQSAVSMQMKRLEAEVGRPLFNRVGKSVELTPEGRTLIPFAMRIVREHDDAVRALTGPDLEGTVRFGSPEHYTIGLLPGILARFSRDFPDIVVEMQCENSADIKAAVDRGTLDVGLTTQLPDGGRVIHHDPVVWAASPGFVVQHHRPLSLAVFQEDCIFRTWALGALEKAGIDYRIVYVSRSISGLIDAVRSGFALAPVIASNLPEDLRALGLGEGLPVLPVSTVVLHRNRNKSSEIIDCFSGHVISAFAAKSAPGT